MKENLNKWKITKRIIMPDRPWLDHLHQSSGHYCYLGKDNHWYCSACHRKAPEPIEDMAFLARCAPMDDRERPQA